MEPKPPQLPWSACWVTFPRRGARPSPSTTAPSSRGTTASTPWASRPSSATPIPPGRREAWRTPSAACGARCPAPPNSAPSRKQHLQRPCSCTTIRPGSASATGPPPRSSTTRWCTSNVNPPSRLRGHNADGAPSRASGQARKDGRGGIKNMKGRIPPYHPNR